MSTSQHTPQHPASGSPNPAAPRARTAPGAPVARRRLPRWCVPLVAALAAAAVWVVGTAAGVELAARSGTTTQDVGLGSVVVVALVVGYAGWGVRALLGRSRSGGERAWLVTCAVVLAVSLLGPLGAVSPGAGAVLVAEHLAVGTVVALGLRRR